MGPFEQPEIDRDQFHLIFGNAAGGRVGQSLSMEDVLLKKNAWSSALRGPAPEDALDFILHEHLRHREMCTALDRLADSAEANAMEAARLAHFIRHDLTLHVMDEEEAFFPLLRARCLPEDEIGPALERMNREHAEDRALAAQVRIVLLTMATEAKPAAAIYGAAEALHLFAQDQRRHMMLENAVLIPLARRRLTDEDVASLGRQLAARRRLMEPTPAK